MKISRIDFNKYYYFGLDKTFGGLRCQILSYDKSFDSITCFIGDKRSLNGESGINAILDGIKNVAITKDEYDRRLKREEEMGIEAMRKENIDYEPMSFLVDAPENFTKEQLSQTYYSWSGGELGFAESYSDVTVCFDNFSDKVEYYYTSEVIEVLEKWKEASEKRNNPKEREKMIKDYAAGKND